MASRLKCRSDNKIGLFLVIAVLCSIGVIGLIISAFWTSSWLVVERDQYATQVPTFNLPFHKLGLWQICFRLYQPGNPFNPFSVICEPVVTFKQPQSQFNIPAFMVATQVAYTISLVLCLIVAIMMIFTLAAGPFPRVLYEIGALLMIAGFCSCIAMVIFAACVFDWRDINLREQTAFGWSFWLAVSGSILLWPCGGIYVFEGRRLVQQSRGSHITVFVY